MMEGVYSRIRYLGRKGKSRKCKGSNRGVRKRIQKKHGRYQKTGKRRRNILERGITRKIHGKKIIQMVG